MLYKESSQFFFAGTYRVALRFEDPLELELRSERGELWLSSLWT